MLGLWLELDQYQAIKMVCQADTATLNQILERDRIAEFLACLNLEFDQVRVQILGKDKLPSLNEVFSIVRSEENRRGAMLGGSNMEGSTLLSSNKSWKQSTNQNKSGREGQWCTFCMLYGSTR